MTRLTALLITLLIISTPRVSMAQEQLDVCGAFQQGNITVLQNEFVKPVKSYFENRNELQSMLTQKELASFENIQKNMREYPGYKAQMEKDKTEINNFFIQIEACIGQNLENASEFPEQAIEEYLTLKEGLTSFFRFDHYFMKGFDKMIHFMLDRRGAYFVKEDVISFIKLSDWEYYRNTKYKMNQIIESQNAILNSLRYNP